MILAYSCRKASILTNLGFMSSGDRSKKIASHSSYLELCYLCDSNPSFAVYVLLSVGCFLSLAPEFWHLFPQFYFVRTNYYPSVD